MFFELRAETIRPCLRNRSSLYTANLFNLLSTTLNRNFRMIKKIKSNLNFTLKNKLYYNLIESRKHFKSNN